MAKKKAPMDDMMAKGGRMMEAPTKAPAKGGKKLPPWLKGKKFGGK